MILTFEFAVFVVKIHTHISFTILQSAKGTVGE